MTKEQFEANLGYIDNQEEIQWLAVLAINTMADCPFSAELEGYSDKGMDMLISVDELSRKGLKKAIKNFNINREVVMWWPNGEKLESVPFNNIKDHYDDIKHFLNKLNKIANKMPF